MRAYGPQICPELVFYVNFSLIFIFASVISVSFAQNRPKSDISGALGPIHYIILKAFAIALGDGIKCKKCFLAALVFSEHVESF